MEGPYRDLGSGFARLTGVEGLRRGPSRLNYVEDALFEMLRNAWEAGANNIYVASSLRARRYRTLTVLDDGHGIPEPFKDLIFEPGVTNRHLSPSSTLPAATTAGSGVSLFHIKSAALSADILSTGNPTAIQTTFDTTKLPERASQANTLTSRSNLLGRIQTFISDSPATKLPKIYYGSPATILATLIKNRIIQTNLDAEKNTGSLKEKGERLGLAVSSRTVQRIERGEVTAVESVEAEEKRGLSGGEDTKGSDSSDRFEGNASLNLNKEEASKIATILREAARTRYLEVGEIELESRPGEIVVRSRVYEPEEEYE